MWMLKLSSFCLLSGLFLLAACGADQQAEAPEPPASEGEEGPLCRFVGFALNEASEPLAGLSVRGRGMVRVDERRWQGATEETLEVAADGRFEFEVPCGCDLSLSFQDWSWPVEPGHLFIEPGMEPRTIYLVPEREAMLRLVSTPGSRLEGQLTRGDGRGTLKIPTSGLQIDGISWGRSEGILSAEGFPDREWRLNRSDELHEVAPDRFEAVVEMGPTAPFWVGFDKVDHRKIEGVWCVAGGKRAAACKLQRGAWACRCEGGRQAAIAAGHWDSVILREASGHDLLLPPLPAAVRQCFDVDSSVSARVGAVGLEADSIVSVPVPRSAAGSEDQPCLDLPAGETFELQSAALRFPFVAGEREVRVPGAP